MDKSLIKVGFIAAGIMNLGGVLILSKFFTNEVINHTDPVVMSNFGLLMIVVWGLVFIGTAFIEGNIRWLASAFALEKLVYVLCWLNWISQNSLMDVYQQDVFAGTFYTIYGVNDFIFMLFFARVAYLHHKGRL